jgi:hypothetical protein
LRPEAAGSFSISDDDILRAQGHKAVFKRSFSIVSSLGFAFKYVSHPLYFALIIPGPAEYHHRILRSCLLLLAQSQHCYHIRLRGLRLYRFIPRFCVQVCFPPIIFRTYYTELSSITNAWTGAHDRLNTALWPWARRISSSDIEKLPAASGPEPALLPRFCVQVCFPPIIFRTYYTELSSITNAWTGALSNFGHRGMKR